MNNYNWKSVGPGGCDAHNIEHPCGRCINPKARPKIELDYSKIEDVEIDGINHRDYPDYVDAYIASATYGGREMTDAELEKLNDDHDYVYSCVIERVF